MMSSAKLEDEALAALRISTIEGSVETGCGEKIVLEHFFESVAIAQAIYLLGHPFPPAGIQLFRHPA